MRGPVCRRSLGLKLPATTTKRGEGGRMRFVRSALRAVVATVAVMAGVGVLAGVGSAAARSQHAESAKATSHKTAAKIKTTKVNVLVVPQASAAPFYVGLKEGLYA